MRMFEPEERRTDGPLTLHVQGEVDSSNASELRGGLRRVPEDEPVVVDLRSVPFMDSAGLGALICGIRELRMSGSSVALCIRRGAVQRLLSVTGFDRIVPTFETLEDAGAALGADKLEKAAASAAG